MNTHADKTQKNKNQSVASAVSQKQSGSESTFQFVDNRPEAIAQRKLQEMANNSPQAKQAAQLQAMANNHAAKQQQPIQKKENNTGLPDNLKSGIENLSGYSMDDVKVHYNSDKPAQLQAHAYAQGTDIHLASGQEKHLPHEAWHVVQQKQGRVKPTMQMKGGVNVNDDAGLEKEADVMGGKALQMKPKENKSRSVANSVAQKKSNEKQGFGFVDNRPEAVAQRKLQEMANYSPQVRQLKVIQEMASNVAQLETIQVGFDNTPTQSMFAGLGDDLTTNGLANCIAIVAYHTGAPSQGAVMRHYDTLNAFGNEERDPISRGIALTFNGEIIAEVAAEAHAQLVAQVPAAARNFRYKVALGEVWSNLDSGTAAWQSRHNLINAIIAGLRVEPIIAAGTVNFDVATSTLL